MIRILVPVDFSEYNNNALNYAVKLGEKLHSEIILAHCFPEIIEEKDVEIPVDGLDSKEVVTKEKEKEKQDLEMLKEKTLENMNEEQRKNITLRTRFEIGYAEDVLVKLSKEISPDVIVMGTKSKGETIKELLGSVTSDVVRKAQVPVLTVPVDSDIDLNKISNILFVTDFSEVDYESLHKLVKLISSFKTVIYSVQFNTSKPDKWDKEKMNEFKNYCNVTYRNHTIKTQILYGEDFLETLDNFIKDNSIDIIAMTRKKRNIISSLFHPSITRKILFHTNIPLLVFHI